jgi:thiol-disulfide isomerase/thioredoxin
MKLTTFALLSCLFFGLGARTTFAAAGRGEQPISADAVLAGLKQAEEKVENLSVKIHWTKFYMPRLQQLDQPVKTQSDATYVTAGPRRIASAYTSEGFSVGPDKKISIYPRRGKMAFDGKLCRVLEGPREIEAWHGSIFSYATWEAGPDPREFTTNYFQEPISRDLKKRGIVLAGQTEWDGHRVTIIEIPPIKSKTGPESRKLSYWIDPQRNWLVVRRAILVQYRPDQKWQEYNRVESRDHIEVKPGIWLPRKLKLETVMVTEKQQPETLAWRNEGEARDWTVNQKLPATQFELEFPPGTPVDDHTVTPQRAYVVPKSKDQAAGKPKRPPIYNEKADAKADIAAALKTAKIQDERVLIIWGGNWCGWCYKLHDVFEDDPDCAKIVLDEFVVVPVDIKTNKTLFDHYVKKADQGGFPFLTVLDADGKVLTNQKSDPLEAGPHHDVKKVQAFLEKWSLPPRDAEKVLADGLSQAKRESKRVFLHVGAPWCGWCHVLDRFLDENSSLFAADFINLKIDADRMQHANNVIKRYRVSQNGGGIPWMAILDADGKLLVTSDAPKSGNIGFPGEPEGIRHFMGMLQKTIQRTTPQHLALIEKKLNEDRQRRTIAKSGRADASKPN